MSDYVSHIILLPQNADWRWYETLRPYLEAFRVTVTKSADDAGSFHGLQHTVTILQSPDAWPDGIVPFFKRRYPNARLDYVQFRSLAQLGELMDRRAAKGEPGRFAGVELLEPAGPPPAETDYDSHIVLMPNGSDWTWYRAIRRYLLRYRVTVTQSADDAGSFHGRNHTVTAIVYPGAWGGGDIVAWLREHYPSARSDLVREDTPEALERRMDGRVSRGEAGRFGQGEPYPDIPPASELESFRLRWPLDPARLQRPAWNNFTRHFAASPWDYRPALPAHEGLDFPGVVGDTIFACADGEVTQLDNDPAHLNQPGNFPYGFFVRIQHTHGNDRYETLYAHLSEVLVERNQRVQAGQPVGRMGRTGRATGPHLHLNLKRFGIQTGEYPPGIIDPLPYLQWPDSWTLAPREDLPNIYGVHEDYEGLELRLKAGHIMQQAGVRGYVLWTERLGADPNNTSGADYRRRVTGDHVVIVRLNHGYEPDGTLPTPNRYEDFARRCANFVRASQGARIYVVGNEMNNRREWPGGVDGEPILPEDYARCFNLVYRRIKDVAPNAIVCPGAIDPYHASLSGAPFNTPYGNVLRYWLTMLDAIEACDGLAVHAYTHGPDPRLVESAEHFSNPPLTEVHYNFRVFHDVLNATPERFRTLPVYLTETNHLHVGQEPNWGWVDINNGWVWAMYQQVDDWNQRGGQQIHAALIYRYPQLDPWVILNKPQVIEDFKDALSLKLRPYYWRV